MRSLLFGACFALCAMAAAAEPSLAERAAAIMRPALPNFDVVVADPLTIHVESGGKTVFQLNLDRIAQFCTQQPDRCDEALADYAAKASRMVADQNAPLAPESLRAVVRPAAYVDALKQQLGGGVEFVAAPLAGDLEVLCYADLPTAMRPVFAADIARLKLDAAAALALCRKNVAAVLPPLKVALEPDAIGTLRGDAYESSYLALHDAWAPLAHSLSHPLLVAAPDADAVFFTEEKDAVALGVLRTLAGRAHATAQRPISALVFRWTETGWEVAGD